MKAHQLLVSIPPNLTRFGLLLGVSLWLAITGTVAATSLQLSFSVPNGFNESNRQAVLEWNGEAGKTYLVQSTDDLPTETGWETVASVTPTQVGPVRWMAPEVIRDRKYYRLILPRPEILSVEPAFVDSSDLTALLYIFGQCLPTNGTVIVNGQNITPTLVDSNGGWVAISLNGLPPGTPVIGSILVLDNASNIVATLPLQTPVFYGTAMTMEQLQGPPDEPPASPESWTKGGGASVGKPNPGRSARWTKGGGASVGKPNPGRSASWTKGGGASVGKPSPGRMARWTKGGGASVGKPNPGRLFAACDEDDDDDGGDLDNPGFNTLLMPALMKAKEKANRTKCGSNLRVIPGTGEVQCDETDLTIEGRGLDFNWTRTYRSRTGPTTAQGAGWDFSYNVSLAQQPDGTIVLRPGNGRADTFYPNGTNGWAREEYFCEVRDLNADGMPDVLFADTGRWLFNPLGTAAGGKLAQIIDRNGNTMSLSYNLKGQLTIIVDDLGRTNTVAYNVAGQIESLTDFSGRTVRYGYDGNGDLIACISPAITGTPNGNDFAGGKTNRYSYTTGQLDDRLNHNLMSCTDGKGQAWLTVVYHATNNPTSLDFDAAASLLRGVDKKDIRRGMVIVKPGYVTRVLQAIIKDEVGNVTECFYDSRFRPVEVREFTGRANPALPTTATENRPTGKLRPTDPEYFETRLEWNADSLCTRVVYPGGNSEEMVYERAFDQNSARSNRRHAGDLRLFREVACCDQDDDGDGLLDTLTTTFEYDPRFGSPAAARGKKLYVGNLPFSRSGIPVGNGVAINTKGTGADKGRFANGPRQTTSLDGTYEPTSSERFGRPAINTALNHRFATSSTDPRGTVTTGEYDNHGNRTKVDKRTYTGGRFILLLDGAASYNSGGQVTAITNAADGNGYRSVDTFTYYTNGPQVGYLEKVVVDVGGVIKSFQLSYDACGNVTRSIDPRGNDTLYTYNALDQLVRCASPTNLTARCTTDFTYDANDNLVECATELRDENDAFVRMIVSRNTFDVIDRPVSEMQQVSAGSFVTNIFSYDANDNLVAAYSPMAASGTDAHNMVAFEYDERGLLFREIDALGSGSSPTNEYSYDPNGRLRSGVIAEVGAGRPATVGRYNGFGHLVSITDPLSNVVSYVYDRNGNPTLQRYFGELNDVPGSAGNRLLAETHYDYDSLDRCVRQVDSFFDSFTLAAIGDGQVTTTFAYAPNGDCLSVTDDNGHVTRYSYDTAGRLSSITDPKTNIASFTYDACDNILSITRSDRSDLTPGNQQFTIVHAYDRSHRLTRSVDNVGNTNRYAYDSLDNLISAVDARDNETVCIYDDLGRCVQTTCYQGLGRGVTINTSHVEYDVNSRCISETDANSNKTFYAYDSMDRHIATTNADGTTQKLIWSPHSNLVRTEDANGTVVSNSFDLLDRCVRRDISSGPGVATTTTFEIFAYDGLSQLVAATNDASACTFAYDSLGNCMRGVSGGIGAMTSTHDGVGNRISMTYPSGRVVTYTYDTLDQMASVRSSSGGLPQITLATFDYEGPGRVGRISRTNNVNTRIQWDGLVSPPNATGDFGWGQVKGINHQVANGGAVIDQRRAAYDRNQNKILRAQTTPFLQGGDTTTNVFEYDPLDRLSRAINTKGTGATVRLYSLDAVGNRQAVVSNGVAGSYTMDATIPPGDFQMNQYTMTPFGGQSYDEDGNLVVRTGATGPTFYHYDYADRLVEVAAITGGGAIGPVASFAYDALGRRISKTTYSSGLPVTTQYFYGGADDCDDVLETSNGGNSVAYCYGAKTGKSGATKRFGIGDTAPACPLGRFTAAGALQFYHCDDLDNLLALTDAQGSVIERYDYDDFGLPQFLTSDGFPMATNASPAGNRFLFHGMEWDNETGLYLSKEFSPAEEQLKGNPRHRPAYVDPRIGRAIWGKVKVIRDMGGSSFSDNNPWSQRSGINGINGSMPNRISMNVTVPKQTQGATFGEKVNAGLHAAGSALSQKLIVPVAMDKGLCFEGGDLAAKLPRNILKSFFQTGDKPTQEQSRAWLYVRPLMGLPSSGK